MDDLIRVYSSLAAFLLPADESRASEKGGIRAYLEKQIGTKMKLNSPGPGFICGGKDVPAVAIENGTYKQMVQAKLLKDTIS